MTRELFREESYLRACEATVVAVLPGGIVLDATIFYADGGGQPGDTGVLWRTDGSCIAVVDTKKDRDSGAHLHMPADAAVLPAVGETVRAEIDWDRRYRLMRMHTCLHLLCAVVPGGVTGGSVGTDRGRLDFENVGAFSQERIRLGLHLVRRRLVRPRLARLRAGSPHRPPGGVARRLFIIWPVR